MKLYLLLLPIFFSIGLLHAQSDQLHPWTDTQGRTLQASFISLDSEKVTIKWNGQVVPIPLVSLSPESQSLASKLSSQMNGKTSPFDTVAPNQLHSRTDVQGRTLQARFVKLFAGTVTIEWNGQMVPLPMTSLSPQSQALANQLASANKPKLSLLHRTLNPHLLLLNQRLPPSLPLLPKMLPLMKNIIGRRLTDP